MLGDYGVPLKHAKKIELLYMFVLTLLHTMCIDTNVYVSFLLRC